MKFIDEVSVHVSAGKGGNGAIGWRREKFVPLGGPSGGNGGNGGAVVFLADEGLNTLIDFSFNPIVKASDGQPGGTQQLADGKSGPDAIYKVPVGTQVFFEDSQSEHSRLVADLSHPNAAWIAARGGRGGKGNTFFKSSTKRAPDFAEKGKAGEEFKFRLVLKSVADIGLVGLPSAGKSTLISRVSAATPKIADYPFTTLAPSLGVVRLSNERRFVVADIPGLIPGAHQGKGLGIQFLRHIERTRALVQMIDVSQTLAENAPLLSGTEDLSEDALREAVLSQFESIDEELRSFSTELAKLPRLVVIAKADLPESKRAFDISHKALQKKGFNPVLASSQNGEGLDELLNGMWHLLHPKD